MIGFGGDPGFGVTFSIMQIMVPVMFVLVFRSVYKELHADRETGC